MESKALDSVAKTDVTKNQVNEIPAGEKAKKIEERYETKADELKKRYDAVSKNGDTLELSEKGKKMGGQAVEDTSPSGKKGFSGSGKKVSDSILTGYSDAKLKQLYANKEITRQQYERIMKMKKKR